VSHRNRGLSIALCDGEIIISIGIATLAESVPMLHGFRVNDINSFAEAVVRELNGNEDETGDNLAAQAIESAVIAVIESGDPSTDEVER
jgi:hypothetical protein